MRHFHVKVYYAHISGSEMVAEEDSAITFARGYSIDGVYISEDWAEVTFNPFGQMTLHHPDPDRNPGVRLPYERFLSSLTEDDWLEGSTLAHPIIPISSLEFIEARTGHILDLTQAA